MNSDIQVVNCAELEPATPFQWASVPLMENHQQSAVSRKKKNAKANPNKARYKNRLEILELRDTVKHLEMKLQQLQSLQKEQNRFTGGCQPSSSSSAASVVWKETCIRQLDQRLRVERENIHLKKRCDREMQVVQNLGKLLYRHPPQHDLVHLGENTRTRRIEIPSGSLKQMAALIFDELSTGLENSYNIAEVMAELNSCVSINEMTQKPVVRYALNDSRWEVLDRHLLPFDMGETTDAWWKHWNDYRGQRSNANVASATPESFGLEFTDVVTDTKATFYVQQVLRRYIEDGRTVIVWNAYIEPFMFENERVEGVYFLKQSNALIKPEYRHSTTNNAVCTQMSTCEIVTPHYLDPNLRNDPKMTALMKFVTSSMSSYIMMRNEKVEDFLMDQSLQCS